MLSGRCVDLDSYAVQRGGAILCVLLLSAAEASACLCGSKRELLVNLVVFDLYSRIWLSLLWRGRLQEGAATGWLESRALS